jgi:L-threonylcarbamoyladenylate synthase
MSWGRNKSDSAALTVMPNNLFQVSDQELSRAAELIRSGRLVAFPTETVYGLGANALDATAVARIFEAKGRPHTSPLIVHVSSIEMGRKLVAGWPDRAQNLAESFWPGPLTLVLPKLDTVPDLVTAGLSSVGIRMPAHPVALALIRKAGVPIAAPSANRFTQLSPTTAEHVREGLGELVDFILDGGPTSVGIESTVVSLAEDIPTLLRPGGISRMELERVIGHVNVRTHSVAEGHEAPGMHPRHYRPRTPMFLILDGRVPTQGKGIYLKIWKDANGSIETVRMPTDPAEYARLLYGTLHRADSADCDWIGVELPPDNQEWEAVLDRLRRAAQQE